MLMLHPSISLSDQNGAKTANLASSFCVHVCAYGFTQNHGLSSLFFSTFHNGALKEYDLKICNVSLKIKIPFPGENKILLLYLRCTGHSRFRTGIFLHTEFIYANIIDIFEVSHSLMLSIFFFHYDKNNGVFIASVLSAIESNLA